MDKVCEIVQPYCPVAAVKQRVEELAGTARLAARSDALKAEFPDVFKPLPHVDEMPSDITCKINCWTRLRKSHVGVTNARENIRRHGEHY